MALPILSLNFELPFIFIKAVFMNCGEWQHIKGLQVVIPFLHLQKCLTTHAETLRVIMSICL
jgi:hypothetical protein